MRKERRREVEERTQARWCPLWRVSPFSRSQLIRKLVRRETLNLYYDRTALKFLVHCQYNHYLADIHKLNRIISVSRSSAVKERNDSIHLFKLDMGGVEL